MLTLNDEVGIVEEPPSLLHMIHTYDKMKWMSAALDIFLYN